MGAASLARYGILARHGILALSSVALISAEPAEARSEAGETADDSRLGDIVVTARRREELLQKTPLSVVALGAGELEDRSITNLRSLQYAVPNLTLAASQNVGEAAGNAFIRGIGQEDFLAGSQAGVGFYLDGVYLATTRGTVMNLIDIERIEVLRGPQGTLFGRNAIGGAINVISVQPQPEGSAKFDAILGSLDRIEIGSVLNEPLAPDLMVRFSARLVSRDGHLRRLPPPAELGPGFPLDNRREGSDRTQAVRFQLRWLATDRLTLDLSADGTRRRNTQGALRVDEINPAIGTLRTVNQLIDAGLLPGPPITQEILPDGFYRSLAGNRNFSDLDSWGVSAVAARSVGFGKLKLIVAYRDLRTRIGTDTDGLYYGILGSEFRDSEQQLSGELQLAGLIGKLAFAAGGYAFGERARSLPYRGLVFDEVLYACTCYFMQGNEPRPVAATRRIKGESYALYGQFTYAMSRRLSSTFGLRYTHDRQSVSASALLVDLATLRATGPAIRAASSRAGWDAVTWRAGIEFQASDAVMIYGSAAKGFKSGGYNLRPILSLPDLGLAPFDPETALTYELGLRSDWFGGRLRFNLTLFDTEYRDIQLRQQTLTTGGFATLIENAAKARIRGAEIEAVARPAAGLTIGASYGRIAARYLDVGRVPNLTLDSRFQRTPGHSASAFAGYEAALPGGAVELHADLGFRSREQFQLIARTYDQGAYALLNARLAYRTADDSWSVALFGTNLTARKYRTAGRGIASVEGVAFSSVGMPRQFGIQVKFGR